jgi:hypothetical protein
MTGPRALTKAKIDELLPRKVIGSYVLSRDGKTAHYVGRSDSDLASRLKSHVGSGDYTVFWYEVVESPMQAYFLESEWYHKYHPADNQNHPAVPPGATWKCPVAGCSWGSFST